MVCAIKVLIILLSLYSHATSVRYSVAKEHYTILFTQPPRYVTLLPTDCYREYPKGILGSRGYARYRDDNRLQSICLCVHNNQLTSK